MTTGEEFDSSVTEEFLPFHSFWGPVLKEMEYFLLIVVLAFLKEAGILDMDNYSFFVKNDKDWIAEAKGAKKSCVSRKKNVGIFNKK